MDYKYFLIQAHVLLCEQENKPTGRFLPIYQAPGQDAFT